MTLLCTVMLHILGTTAPIVARDVQVEIVGVEGENYEVTQRLHTAKNVEWSVVTPIETMTIMNLDEIRSSCTIKDDKGKKHSLKNLFKRGR